MIFAITFISLFVISTIVGITFGIYGYASAKLWERNEKTMSEREWEEAFPKYAIRSNNNYIGLRIYTSWDPNTDKWSKQLRWQWFNKDYKLIKFKINKPDWWQN